MTKIVVEEDENGELYIELPAALIKEKGWDIGTELVWTVNDDGTIGIRKIVV